MQTLGFLSKIKKITALTLMGYFTVLSPVTLLAQVSQPVSAPITIPVPVPVPTSAPLPTPVASPSATPIFTPRPTPAPILNAPVMVYPQNGQTLDLEGAYMFKVQPVPGAQGYLFGFFQNGVMVYENLRDQRRLSPNGILNIWPNDPAHARFKAGPVQVWVRALVNNRWTNARIITIILKPRVVQPRILSTWPNQLKEGRYFTISGSDFGNRQGQVKLYKSGIAINVPVYYWSNNYIVTMVPARFSNYRNYTLGLQVNTAENKQSPIIYRSASK